MCIYTLIHICVYTCILHVFFAFHIACIGDRQQRLMSLYCDAYVYVYTHLYMYMYTHVFFMRTLRSTVLSSATDNQEREPQPEAAVWFTPVVTFVTWLISRTEISSSELVL